MKSKLKQPSLRKKNKNALCIKLHRKEFLQPFEKVLSNLELENLGIIASEKKSDILITKINSKKSYDSIKRLTYFDWYSDNEFHPTLQSCREGTNPLANNVDDPTFTGRRLLRFGPHNLHVYRGKFFPQLVRSICNISGLNAGDKVLDPMCGSGTTIVEARSLDIHAVGLDRNPLSVLISDVKATSISWNTEEIQKIKKSIDNALTKKIISEKSLWNTSDEIYLNRWFSTSTLNDLSSLLMKIGTIRSNQARKFALVCLSDIIRTVSYQKINDLRVRKEMRPYRNGECLELFRDRITINLNSIDNLNKVDPGHNEKYEIKLGDARNLDKIFSRHAGTFDAVITSPPYATALPYLDTDRLSLIVLGLLSHADYSVTETDMIGSREISEPQRKEIWNRYLKYQNQLPSSICDKINEIASIFHDGDVGFRRKNLPSLLSKYFFDMQIVFQNMQKLLKNKSPAFLVIGNNSTNSIDGKISIPTDEFLIDIAKQVGFSVYSELNMELLSSNDPFKRNRGTKERVIHLVNS